MTDAFPLAATLSLRDATPGSIVRIGRSDGCKIALVTAEVVNDVRSFVWLNPGFKNRPAVIFAENWRNDPSVLQYTSTTRFELGSRDSDLDFGRNAYETVGSIVSIGDGLYLSAAPFDDFSGWSKLVNIQDGSVYSGDRPTLPWSFLSWQLWVRSSKPAADFMLTEFRLPQG